MRGIGQMARETGLTVSALRFYDGAGVLVPARVDPHSNYRWYTDEQVVSGRLVARLRRVGMPLDDIRRLLDNRQSRRIVDQILQTHLRRLEDGLADARRELSTTRSLIDQESPMSPTRITTTAHALAGALRAVRHAVGTDPALPMLTGVLVEIDDGCRVVASDRYRLAVSAVATEAVEGPPATVIAPVDVVDEALALLGGDDAPVGVLVDGAELTVELPGHSLRGTGIDSDFPDYRRVLRTAGTRRVEVDVPVLRAELAAAPTRTVRREEDGAEQSVTVLTLGSDGTLSVTPGDPGVLEIGVNREFLLEALDAGGSGQLVLDLDGPISPLAIRDPHREGSVRMLMPIRLS